MFDLGLPSVFRKILLKDKVIEVFRRHRNLLKLLYPLRVSKRIIVIHSVSVLLKILMLIFSISSILSLFNIADTGHCSHAVTLHDYL